MSIYNSIVYNITKLENINCFNLKYKYDGIHYILKIHFSLLLKNSINIKSKYTFFINTLHHFCVEDILEEQFIALFCKIQKTYNMLNKFVYNYKYKKAKTVVTTDMGLNELCVNSPNVICLFHVGSKYLFHINDLIKIINTSLTNSYLFYSEPIAVKNPYNNLPFDKSTLYNIYFFIKYKTNYSPDLFFKFFECNFNLTLFNTNNEYVLREKIIRNYVYNSNSHVLYIDIMNMIFDFNLHKDRHCTIEIDVDFPKSKLIKIFQPYLLLYIQSKYSMLEHKQIEADRLLEVRLIRFQKCNPRFGTKQFALIMEYHSNFKKIVKHKVYFIEAHIGFNNVCQETETFLTTHLNF